VTVLTLEESALEKKIKDFRIRLSVRLEQIIPLLDGFKLLEALQRAGYMPLIPPQHRPLAHGVNLRFEGLIARKGENVVDGNTDRGVLGVEGPSFESVVKCFEELRNLVNEDLGFDIEEVALFYEVIAQFSIETLINPLETIRKAYGDSGLITTISNIIGQETSLFSFRFVPRGRTPNQVEWFDIIIEPDLIKPTNIYTVYAIYRSADRSKINKIGNELVSKLLRFIDEIEKQ
jgi:hypothetical protein